MRACVMRKSIVKSGSATPFSATLASCELCFKSERCAEYRQILQYGIDIEATFIGDESADECVLGTGDNDLVAVQECRPNEHAVIVRFLFDNIAKVVHI